MPTYTPPLYQKPGESFTIVIQAATGLAGTIGVQILDSGGDLVVARTTAEFEELPAGSGSYQKTLVAPIALDQYTILVDTGTITPETSVEIILVVNTSGAPVVVGVGPEAVYAPTVADIGRLLRARTKDSGGNETGTFGTSTRPTGGDVEIFIAQAANKLSTIIGDVIPEALYEEAKETVAIRAAMMIELSYWPEQMNTERSTYLQLKALWDEAIGVPGKPGSLLVAVQQAMSDLTVDAQGAGAPAGYIITGSDPMLVGWRTRW
jgi:hypothetical protein